MADRLEQITTVPGMGRSLIEHDPSSFLYPARGVLMEAGLPRKTRTWRRPPAYDQGKSSACVGYTFRGVLNSSPHAGLVASAQRKTYDAVDFYRNGQVFDQWPGEEPVYFGTSALGVCKYLVSRGYVKEYRWCFGVSDVLDTLSQYGPVGIGVQWGQGMMETDDRGFISASGALVGGHEVELHGINVRDEYVIGTNSWGPEWGDRGRFKLSWVGLGALLQNSGDAVTVVRV